MKPLHVGLLVIGAAVAGGLAVRMTQPPPLPNPAAVPVKPPAAQKAPVPEHRPEAAQPETPRPSVEQSASFEYRAPAVAPPPIFEEPRHVEPTVARRKPLPPAAAAPMILAKSEPAADLRPAPYEEPHPVAPPAPDPAPAPIVETPAPSPRQVTLKAGWNVAVRLNQTLSTDHVAAGDSFQASLAEPLIVNGLVIAERGARAVGRVLDARRAGRLSGVSSLELGLITVYTSDGQKIAISTEPWSKQAPGGSAGEAAKIGGGAALGAIIGAIAGGGAGAAIGAGVGGGAGLGAAAATGAKPLSIPNETIVRFRLAQNVTITERQL